MSVRFCAAAAVLLASPALAQEFDCLVEARETVEIRSPVEAIIESVPVQRGERVKRGQVVSTLESRVERATLESARARASMEGQVDAAQARLELARRKLDRAEKLHQQNFISPNARDEAAADVKLAEGQLREAQEAKRLAELEVKRAEELLAMRTLRSPFDGVVIERYLRPGEFATTNVKQPIMKLAAIDPLHVEVILPMSQLGKVRAAQKALVMPESPVGGSYAAKVAVVDPVVDAASGTFGVRLVLPNPRSRIPAGVKCKVRFE
jgi:RND family efflux transporter MFP subunit